MWAPTLWCSSRTACRCAPPGSRWRSPGANYLPLSLSDRSTTSDTRSYTSSARAPSCCVAMTPCSGSMNWAQVGAGMRRPEPNLRQSGRVRPESPHEPGFAMGCRGHGLRARGQLRPCGRLRSASAPPANAHRAVLYDAGSRFGIDQASAVRRGVAQGTAKAALRAHSDEDRLYFSGAQRRARAHTAGSAVASREARRQRSSLPRPTRGARQRVAAGDAKKEPVG